MINFICSNQRVTFFLLHRHEYFENKKTRRKTKEKQRNDVSDMFTSEDMENISLVSRMKFRTENTSCLFFGKTVTRIYVMNKITDTSDIHDSPKFYWIILTSSFTGI